MNSHFSFPVDKGGEIPGLVRVSNVQVMRRHVEFLVLWAEELNFCEPDLTRVTPVGQDLHGNIKSGRHLQRYVLLLSWK